MGARQSKQGGGDQWLKADRALIFILIHQEIRGLSLIHWHAVFLVTAIFPMLRLAGLAAIRNELTASTRAQGNAVTAAGATVCTLDRLARKGRFLGATVDWLIPLWHFGYISTWGSLGLLTLIRDTLRLVTAFCLPVLGLARLAAVRDGFTPGA